MKMKVVFLLVVFGWVATAAVPPQPPVVWNVILPDNNGNTANSANIPSLENVRQDQPIRSDQNIQDDVYWKTFKGEIPRDALVGGYEETECGTKRPLYMGQVFHKPSFDSAIIPAQMDKKIKSARVIYGGKEYRYKHNIKVLCAEDPTIVTWVPFSEALKYFNGTTVDKDCVIAGFELNFNVFLGRTKYEDETVIGKVLFHRKLMYFPFYGEEVNVDKDFEILCYTDASERRAEFLKNEEKKKKRVAEEKI